MVPPPLLPSPLSPLPSPPLTLHVMCRSCIVTHTLLLHSLSCCPHVLLQVVYGVTQQNHVRTHLSFSTAPPFMTTPTSANAPCTPSALLAVVGMSVALGHVEVVWLEQLLCSLGCMLRCGGGGGVTMETAPCDVGQLRKVSLIGQHTTSIDWSAYHIH